MEPVIFKVHTCKLEECDLVGTLYLGPEKKELIHTYAVTFLKKSLELILKQLDN
jgi:hypothetical protein